MVAEDVARIRELWDQPELVSAGDVPWLESLVAQYPAAVSLWWLYVRAVQRADGPQFAHVLQRCAAVSPNRAALMAWVEEPLLPVARDPEVAQDVAPVAEVEPVEAVKPLEATKPVHVVKPVEAVKPVEGVKPIEVVKPVEAVTPTSPPLEVNLDALPEKVREQILRARALKAKLSGEVVIPTAAVKAPAVPKPVVAPEPDVLVPSLAAAKPAEPKEGKVRTVPKAPKEAAAAVPAPPEASAELSPFAQFVAQLAVQSGGRSKSEELIDQFLTVNPRISPVSKDAPVAEVRTQPDAQVTGLVTETLARMYAEQGHVAKAIQAYEILKLRVPEKSMIFAARIEALRNS